MKDARAPVDFRGAQSELLLNPRLPAAERARLQSLFERSQPLAGHVYVASSGTTGAPKLVVLPKSGLLASAESVTEHLASGTRDRWLLAIPSFHVGGLGLWARSFVSSAPVEELDTWSAPAFERLARERACTLSALVPTQVHDLVAAGLCAPAGLRAIVVGGARLPQALYERARALGWPLLPSFGMTESASQVATASLESLLDHGTVFPGLKLLRHVEARVSADGYLEFRGPSMLAGYLSEQAGAPLFHDPKGSDGFFRTEDRGSLRKAPFKTFVEVEGRGQDFAKINGELVSLPRLEEIWARVSRAEVPFAIVAVPDERQGERLIFCTEREPDPESLRAFESEVAPFERFSECRVLAPLPRTSSGKIDRRALLA
jgi:O-succinylbenzoic acid--CoA ligase